MIQDPGAIVAPEWTPEFAAPLVNTQFSLGEAIEAIGEVEYFGVNEEGVFHFHYEDTLLRFSAEELVDLPDASFLMFQPSLEVPFPVNGLEELVLKEGWLVYEFSQEEAPGVALQLTSTSASQAGAGFQVNQTYLGTEVQRDSVKLSGTTFSFTDGTIQFSYQALRTDNQQSVELPNLTISLKGLEFSYAEGFFTNLKLNLGADQLDLDLDFGSRLEGGEIEFADPSVGLIVHNSMGIPAAVHIHELAVLNAEQETISLLKGDELATNFLPYPSLAEQGQVKSESYWLNVNNSNLVVALHAQPEQVNWDFDLEIHPPQDPNKYGFLTNSSEIQFGLAIDLPIHGQASSFFMTDTFETEIPELPQIGKAAIQLIIENEIPLEAQMQAYFLDADLVVIDSLFNAAAYLLPPPPINALGEVAGPTKESLTIALDQDKLARIARTRFIAIDSRVATAWEGRQAVKFQPTNQLTIKMGVIASPSL